MGCTVKLGDDDRRAGGKPYKEAYEQIDECTCCTADGRQSLFTDKFAYDGCVYCVVELLEKGAEQNRKEKQ